MTFATLGLHPGLLKALAAAGYQSPTPVQTQTIPAALEGRDLMVSSQTGSGKTAAFILPAIHLLATTEQATSPAAAGNPHKRGRNGAGPARPRMLVLTPTRELALQVTAATDKYGTHVRQVTTASILGGMPHSRQRQALAQKPDILVAGAEERFDALAYLNLNFHRRTVSIAGQRSEMERWKESEGIRACSAEAEETSTYNS